MILNNYWKWKKYCYQQQASRTSSAVDYYTSYMVATDGTTPVKIGGLIASNFSGNNYYIASNACCVRSMSLLADSSLIFSDIDTTQNPLSEDMYTISTISGLSQNSYTKTYNDSTGKGAITLSYTGTNTTNTEKVITCVGFKKKLYYFNGAATEAEGKDVLLAICELNEPLIVPPYSGFSINIEWDEV